jgi:hypothetical protein
MVFVSQFSLSKESKYPMVIRIEEGWAMVQRQTGPDAQYLNPVVLVSSEFWYPGQSVRTQDETHAVHGSMTVSAKQTSAVMAVPFSEPNGQSLSAPDTGGFVHLNVRLR